MAFEQDYFNNRKYSLKEQLVKRHVLEVLGWASKYLHEDLLNGQGKRALDVGCAYGYASHVLAGLGYETFGVDISKWGVKQTENVTNAQFLICDAQTSLPIKNGAFNLVTCFDVLEHLSYPEKMLRGMFEACKGTIVCTTPNRKVEKAIRKITGDYDETHISVKLPSQWQQCITSNLNCKAFKVEAFYDLAVKFRGKLFFKSFNIPNYGLTVRIVVEK